MYQKSGRYERGQASLNPESIDRIMRGQKPLKEDSFIVPRTVDLYEDAANRLMDFLQKRDQRKLSFSYFFEFDDMDRMIYQAISLMT